MEKYNVDNLNQLVAETGKLIDDDPLLGATDEISEIKENFEAIHSAISDEGMSTSEKQGFIASIITKLTKKDKDFRYKSFEGKINSIFRQFDLTFDSIENSIEMYEKYSEGLNKEIENLKEFLETIKEEELKGNEILEYQNYQTVLGTLTLSLGRISMSLESAKSLSETMRVTRPTFQATLSSCMIEVAGQRTLEASAQMLNIMSGTIESLSAKLTDSTIHTSKMALEMGSKPLLSSGKLKDNILKLEEAFTDLEDTKNKYLLNKGE